MKRLLMFVMLLLCSSVATAQNIPGWLIPPNNGNRTQGVPPTCVAAVRNYIWMQESPSGSVDLYQVCQRQSDGTYAWASIAPVAIATPAAPTVTQGGTAGSTGYSYKVVARVKIFFSAASTATATTTGNATLSAANYNLISWSGVSGATSYDVYRTVSSGTPSSLGYIGNTSSLTFRDTGIAGNITVYSSSGPNANTSGGIAYPGALVGGGLEAYARYFQIFGGITTPYPNGEIATTGKISSYGVGATGFSGGGQLRLARIGGTLASPTTMISNASIARISALGYGANTGSGGFYEGARIDFITTEAWSTPGFAGTKIDFLTSANGTNSQANALSLGQDQSATHGGDIITGGTAPAVSNTTANSCGTTTATIAGNDNTGEITVGATGATSCTITFVKASGARRNCFANDETTAVLTRAIYVNSTTSKVEGVFTAGDVISYLCFAR